MDFTEKIVPVIFCDTFLVIERGLLDMALFVIYILLIAVCIIKRRSKLCFSVLLIYLWILCGWSSGNADWTIYLNRYENYLDQSGMTEPLFTMMIKLGHSVGADYRHFLIVISAMCLLLIGFTFRKLSDNPGLPLALYSIFCFPMDVTQIRFFVATALVCFSYVYLYSYIETHEKKDLIRWIICIILAACNHASVLVLLLILVPIYCKRRTTIFTALGINVFVIGFSSATDLFYNLVSSVLSDRKAGIILRVTSRYTMNNIQYVWFKLAISVLGFVLIYFILYNRKFGNGNCLVKNSKEFQLDLNIIMLVTFGLVTITTDFYRLYQPILLSNYIFYSNNLVATKRGHESKSNIIIIVIALIIAIISIYYLAGRGANYQNVMLPLFNNNQLLQ